MNDLHFVMPTRNQPRIQITSNFPLSGRDALSCGGLDNILGLHLSQPLGISNQNRFTHTVLRPKAVRLSDLKQLGHTRLFDCSRNNRIEQAFQDFRYSLQGVDASWDLQTLSNTGYSLDVPTHYSNALLFHQPGFGGFMCPVAKPGFQNVFQNIFQQKLQLLPFNRNDDLERYRHDGSETDIDIGKIHLHDLSHHVFPFETPVPYIIPSSLRIGQSDEELTETGSFQIRKDIEKAKTAELRKEKLYVQKLRQKSVKYSKKHFLTLASHPSEGKAKQFKYAKKSVKDPESSYFGEAAHNDSGIKGPSTPSSMFIDEPISETTGTEINMMKMNDLINPEFQDPNRQPIPRIPEEDNREQPQLGNCSFYSLRSSLSGDRKVFKCLQCRYLTDRKNNLKRHIVTMHQESSKTLECCGIAFQSKAALRDHNAIFHRCGYRCQICSRNFCRKALLRRHLTVHSGQKDFFCHLCGYATSHKSNLERHQKVHNKRDFVSSVNKRAVSLKQIRNRHGFSAPYPSILVDTGHLEIANSFLAGRVHHIPREKRERTIKHEKITLCEIKKQTFENQTEESCLETAMSLPDNSVKPFTLEKMQKEIRGFSTPNLGQMSNSSSSPGITEELLDNKLNSSSQHKNTIVVVCKCEGSTSSRDQNVAKLDNIKSADGIGNLVIQTEEKLDARTDSPRIGLSNESLVPMATAESVPVSSEQRLRMCSVPYTCPDCQATFSSQLALASHSCRYPLHQLQFGISVVTAMKRGRLEPELP